MLIVLLLFFSGIVSAFINTMAGGGSVINMAVLIFAGVPSTVANGTNRVAILLQNIVGVHQFHNKHKKIKIRKYSVIPAVLGAVVGSVVGAKLPSAMFDKLFSVVLIGMLFVIFMPKKSQKINKGISPVLEVFIFVIVGLYGGMIQTGVGFLLLLTLNKIENLDLVSANAYKLFIVLCYLPVSLFIFFLNGNVIFKYGIPLGLGSMVGAYVSSNLAIKKGAGVVKVVLLIAIMISLFKLLGGFDWLAGVFTKE